MQTFLPFPDFIATAKSLDWRRLGKQRVEAKQILDILEDRTIKKGWRNHPAVLMWVGHVDALKAYFNVISREWVNRGYRHNMGFFEHDQPVMPAWFGNQEFHKAHRSNLVRKDQAFYQPKFPDVDGSLPYIWPTESSK